jgi:hypothetical protein
MAERNPKARGKRFGKAKPESSPSGVTNRDNSAESSLEFSIVAIGA